jgi:murein DD-endopeptidase MepM/ murein hydrolase activator NlpD
MEAKYIHNAGKPLRVYAGALLLTITGFIILMFKYSTDTRLLESRYWDIEQEKTELSHEVSRYKTLYQEGLEVLEKKLSIIQTGTPELLENTKGLIGKFKNAVGPADLYSVEELLFLVTQHPSTLSEAMYEQLRNEQGIHHYISRYPFCKSPLSDNGETIITSELGKRYKIIDDFSSEALIEIGDNLYKVPGYGGAWERKKYFDDDVLIQTSSHNGYDLINRKDNRIFAPFDGSIVADLPAYDSFGRTIFLEIMYDGKPYRYQFSHLSAEFPAFEAGEKVGKDQHIGYIGDTGYTTGTHLHLQLWKQNPERRNAWKTVDMFIPLNKKEFSNTLYVQYAEYK